MDEEIKQETKEYSIGYKIGEVFAIFIAGCAMLLIGGLTIGCLVRFFQWLF